MKTHLTPFLFAAFVGLVVSTELHAQGTAFTYQGRLNDGPAPANGAYDLKFSLFGESSGGTALVGPLDLPAVTISKGLFTVLLDFGSDIFTGADRWLEVAVHSANGGAFTTLSPRQPITATPYALTALKVHGIDGHSLHSADGNLANAVFVDNSGNVGIGTTQPTSKLEIAGQDALAITGFQPFLIFRDGSAGMDRSLIQSASGGLNLFAESYLNQLNPSAFVRLDRGGFVGIGTAAPNSKLDVRGDILLGPAGQFYATSGEENLRIVRGFIGGGGDVLKGVGFKVSHPARGAFDVTFKAPFGGPPVVTATCNYEVNDSSVTAFAVTAAGANFRVRWAENQDTTIDTGFNFIAIGPR